MNHYKLKVCDGDSDSRFERRLVDACQGRRPSVAAWNNAATIAQSWGKGLGLRLVVYELTDPDTGKTYGKQHVPLRYESDADDGFHHLQDAVAKFRRAGWTQLAEKIERLIEAAESLDSHTPGGR